VAVVDVASAAGVVETAAPASVGATTAVAASVGATTAVAASVGATTAVAASVGATTAVGSVVGAAVGVLEPEPQAVRASIRPNITMQLTNIALLDLTVFILSPSQTGKKKFTDA
jgi:hypothetical protein